jgi:hypothetical protein
MRQTVTWHSELQETNANAMTTSDKADRVERRGRFVISGVATYLDDVQVLEPRITIARRDGNALEFVVPCGPECDRKNADDAINAGWAAARQWLDDGKIPWRAKPVDDSSQMLVRGNQMRVLSVSSGRPSDSAPNTTSA